MKKSLSFLILLLCLTILALPASGQGGVKETVRVNLAADRDKITIGDLVTLTLEVKTPPAALLKEPDLSTFLKDFELRNAKKPLTQEKEGEKTTIYQYEITTFVTGKKTLGPLEVDYKENPGGSEWKQIRTKALAINVESVLPKDLKNVDIKDIKPPIEVAYPWYYYAVVLASALLLALIIFLVVRHILKKRARAKALADEIRKSPEEIANERLRKLKESSLIHEGKVKEYYIELSDIVREYLEGRYEPHALDMTTVELFRALKDSKIPQSAAGDIKVLLSHCDLVKFAKFVPAESRMESDYRETEKILETIKPQEPLETHDHVAS